MHAKAMSPPSLVPLAAILPHVPPGSRGESHPPAPTEPDVSLSAHPALVVLVTRPCGTIASERAWPETRW